MFLNDTVGIILLPDDAKSIIIACVDMEASSAENGKECLQ